MDHCILFTFGLICQPFEAVLRLSQDVVDSAPNRTHLRVKVHLSHFKSKFVSVVYQSS